MNENNFNNIDNNNPENNQQPVNNTYPENNPQTVNAEYTEGTQQTEFNPQTVNNNSAYYSNTQDNPQNITSYSQPQENSQYNNNANPYVNIPQNNIQQPVYQQYNSQFPQYDSNAETQTFTVPQYQEANPQPPKKKSNKGKKIALITCALALTLCVGIGGGFLGSYLAGSGVTVNAPASTSSNPSDTSTGETSQNSDSGITIIQASDTEPEPTTTQEVVEKVKDAVVEITTEITQYDSFYGQYVSSSAGSGVIISEDGYIITNNHVIEDASSVTVRLTNGESYDAKLVGTDSTLDVALLKIEAENLTVATFGDSSKLAVGQTAIAVGNPLGELGGTVTDGIISALDREISIDGQTMNLLQTNAAINPGNSGGGLFDANGNLIGLVVAKSTSTSSGTSLEGLGFAIPVNDIIDILGDLKTSGYVTGRPSLGVSLVDITSADSMFMYRVDREGTYVSELTSGGAAETAGVQVGDCIIKVGDEEVTTSSEVKNVLSNYKAGDTINITVYRDGQEITLSVTLGESVPSNIFGSGSSNSTNRYSENYYYN